MLYDLNVPWESDTKYQLPQRLRALEKRTIIIIPSQSLSYLYPCAVGYHAVAINQRVEGKLPKTKCPFGRVDYGGQSLRQYSRLTLVLSDPQQNYGINSGNEVIRSYDFLAIQPESEKMFQSACATLEVDIISLDLSSRLSFPLKAGYIRQALARGIAFEILYGPLVADATARRNIIGNVRALLRLALARGVGIIISSAAQDTWQLRAPADVLNLAGFMGIPAHAQKACIQRNPEAVFMHAASRKHTHRSAISIMPSEGKEDKQMATTTTTTDMLDDFVEFK